MGNAIRWLTALPCVVLMLGLLAACDRSGATSLPAVPYPATVAAPASVPPLPTDRGVGAASFVYSPCNRDTAEELCRFYLVMPDGVQYALDEHVSVGRFSLSPDGRWFAWSDGFFPGTGTMHVRDLTGTRVHSFGEDGGAKRELYPSAWSPQSRYLVVNISGYTEARVDVTTGAVATFTSTVLGVEMVLDSGELLALENRSPQPYAMVSIDAGTGMVVSKFPVPGLTAKPDLYPSWPAAAACSCAAWVQLNPSQGMNFPKALAKVDLGGGRVVATLDLPPSSEGNTWSVLSGSGADHIILVHRARDRTEIVLLNDSNGERRIVTTLPADAEVVARGGVRRPNP